MAITGRASTTYDIAGIRGGDTPKPVAPQPPNYAESSDANTQALIDQLRKDLNEAREAHGLIFRVLQASSGNIAKAIGIAQKHMPSPPAMLVRK